MAANPGGNKRGGAGAPGTRRMAWRWAGAAGLAGVVCLALAVRFQAGLRTEEAAMPGPDTGDRAGESVSPSAGIDGDAAPTSREAQPTLRQQAATLQEALAARGEVGATGSVDEEDSVDPVDAADSPLHLSEARQA